MTTIPALWRSLNSRERASLIASPLTIIPAIQAGALLTLLVAMFAFWVWDETLRSARWRKAYEREHALAEKLRTRERNKQRPEQAHLS